MNMPLCLCLLIVIPCLNKLKIILSMGVITEVEVSQMFSIKHIDMFSICDSLD